MAENSTQKPNFFKNFLDWFSLKPKLDKYKRSPLFNEREVWYCHLGTNIGFELDGKKTELLRPAIVFKKLSKDTLLIIPLTKTLKNGSWYSPSFIQNKEGRFCLNQIKMIDSKRLKYKIAQIDDKDFEKLKQDFDKMLKK
jgi:mRNA-degrading endonuclease toxin of MazEF toxin-antitoxin module